MTGAEAAHGAQFAAASRWAQQVEWEGRSITLRPIGPDDEDRHLAFLTDMEPADIRMRLFHVRSSIAPAELRRLTQIDPQREMAFVAVDQDAHGKERTLGVARAIGEPGQDTAEFGIMVRSDLKGRRLGELLLRQLIAHQSEQGRRKLVATVLAENSRMLELARRLDFVQRPCDEGDGVCCIELNL